MFKPLLTFIFITVFLFGTVAQNPARTGKDYAYFFYITTFQDRGWASLPETQPEVEAIAAELRDSYGFRTDITANPTRQQVLDKIAEINQHNYGLDDQVLFFFSTHGHYQKETERGFLIPADGKADDPYGSSWISYDDLGSYVTLCPAPHVLLALDACYSGSFGDRWKGQPGKLPWADTDSDCQTKAANALRWDSRLYFSSGSKEQRTPAQSKFASRWLEALRQGAGEGIVRTKDLRYFLSAIEYPMPEGGTFTSKHEEGGDFVFVHKNACTGSPAASDDQSHWLSVQDDFTKENIRQHLDLFPGCTHRKVLENLKGKVWGNPSQLEAWGGENADLPNMVLVKGGTFQMGSHEGDRDEKPVHTVTLDDFLMARHEVTFAEFDTFCEAVGRNKPHDNDWGRGKKPILLVDWYDAIEYCNWRSGQEGLSEVYTIRKDKKDPNNTQRKDRKKWLVSADWTANGYRLPTEAEWEYAARSGGQPEIWPGTSEEKELHLFANFWEKGKSDQDGHEGTASAGAYQPNALGLFDLGGNLMEWCWDWKAKYSSAPQTNPRGPKSGSKRAMRGGAWNYSPPHLRCTNRHDENPSYALTHIGFRVVRAVK